MTAIAMKRVAQRGSEDPGAAYTIGLLRPLGRIVIAQLLEKHRIEARYPGGDRSVPQWEREEFGLTYVDAGAAACDQWRFPKSIGIALRKHLTPWLDPIASPFSHMLNLGAQISTELGRGLPGEENLFREDPLRFRKTGILEEDLEEITVETLLEFDRTKALLAFLRG